jgi:hypothetical protein
MQVEGHIAAYICYYFAAKNFTIVIEFFLSLSSRTVGIGEVYCKSHSWAQLITNITKRQSIGHAKILHECFS